MEREGNRQFLIDGWRVSPSEGLLSRDNDTVRLEPKAMEVLVYLASRPGVVVTREDLERDVWRGALVGADAITNTVIKLRKALQDSARQPRCIQTIPKKGYQLIASISYLDDQGVSEEVPGTTPAATNTTTEPHQNRQPTQVKRIGTVAVLLVIALFMALSGVWYTNSRNSGPPSIAVLPFENLGTNPKQDDLANGMTEDIITDLSRLSNIMVIASNTTSTYKGRRVIPEEIGSELGVDFLLKGSIRRLGDAVRVSVQLVNTRTGFNTWAQRYDRKLAEVFALQDEVTHKIVDSLSIKITNQEQNRLAQKATDNLKAYQLFQEGQRLTSLRTQRAFGQAREAYQKAIELDPGYGRAYGALAVILSWEYLTGMTDTPIETMDRALELAKKAVELEDTTPHTHWALGFVHVVRREYEQAEKAARRSVSIAPNYADGYGLLGLISMYLGEPEEALEINARGMRLNPYYTWHYLFTKGASQYMLGKYEMAILSLEQARSRNENTSNVMVFLAAAYARAGRQADAEWIIDRIQILNPFTTLSSLEKSLPLQKPEHMQALLRDLRQAGMTE